MSHTFQRLALLGALLLIGAGITLTTLPTNAAIIFPPPPPTGNDDDGDGVENDIDQCTGTVADPEPTEKHHAWLVDDTFTTRNPKTKALEPSPYTMEDTKGCSCLQILDVKPGEDVGEEFHGCTKGIMDKHIKNVQ